MKKNILQDRDWTPQKVEMYYFYRNLYTETLKDSQKTMMSFAIGAIGLLVGLSNFLSFSSIWQVLLFVFSLFSLMLLVIYMLELWVLDAKISDINADLLITENKKAKNKLKIQLYSFSKSYKKSRCKAKWFWRLALFFIILFAGITICVNYKSQKEVVKKVKTIAKPE